LAEGGLGGNSGNIIDWTGALSSPQVCGGDLCATGTRIPVTVILDSLAEGATKGEVLASYPSLRADHINAALAYAAALAHEESLVPIRALSLTEAATVRPSGNFGLEWLHTPEPGAGKQPHRCTAGSPQQGQLPERVRGVPEEA